MLAGTVSLAFEVYGHAARTDLPEIKPSRHLSVMAQTPSSMHETANQQIVIRVGPSQFAALCFLRQEESRLRVYLKYSLHLDNILDP